MKDKETLKDSVANAYNLGQEDGFGQGKIAVITSLRKTMDKMGRKTVNYEMIKAMEAFLKLEYEKQSNL